MWPPLQAGRMRLQSARASRSRLANSVGVARAPVARRAMKEMAVKNCILMELMKMLEATFERL
jgi:hypothetical protein